MSFIIKRVINNATYMYEITSYRNEDGKPRNKQRCLGRIGEDGVLIVRKKKRKIPTKVKEIKTTRRKIIFEEIPEKNSSDNKKTEIEIRSENKE